MADEILIRLPREQVPDFDASREQVGLAYATTDAVVLRRRRTDRQQGKDVLRLVGHPRAIWVGDLLYSLNLNHASGLLVFQEGPVRREVYLKNGEIIFAQSNQNDDRLGESLVRAGKITQQQLDDAAKEISPERKLGKIMIDRGWVSPKELFLGVRRQVEEIIWNLFDAPARYVFMEGFANPESVIALNLDTHRLLVEGIRRSAPWRGVSHEISERELMLTLVSNPKNLGLNQGERRLVALIVQGISMRELIDQSGMGVLETYKLVHHLLEREVIAVGAAGAAPATAPRQQRAARSELEKTIYNFQTIFMDIISLLKARVKDHDVIERLNSFFDNLAPELAAVFQEVRFAADGTLDIPRIVENLEGVEGNRRTTVLRAFNELLYFTLFEMKNFLSDEDTDRIMEIIEHMEIF